MKKVLIIAHFFQVPLESGNNRFAYLANLLGQNGHDVEVITSKFSHAKKSQRNVAQEEIDKLNYKLTMIDEPGYKKNVSLKRFFSHYKMSKNLKKYFKKIKKPDVIYCAIPSLDIAFEAAKYAKKNNIKFIIDVQDIWPEAFKLIFKVPLLNDITFLPMKLRADYIYKRADNIIAVSETYANRAAKVNKKYKTKDSVFLGTNLSYFDKCNEDNYIEKDKNLITLTYIGTLGHSYNIKIIIDAISILNKKGINNLKFLIMGEGPLKSSFEDYSKEKQINVEFTGRLPYPEMVGRLCASDIAINCISKGAAQSIINKVGDYASAGLPVLNTQECKEYRDLVENYKCGINCINDDVNDIVEKMQSLIGNEELRKTYGINNRKLADEKFDRKITYPKIIELILGD